MTLTPQSASSFVLAELKPSFIETPYPSLRVLRDHAPVCQQPDGSYVISRYDDVKHALSDAAIFSSDKRRDFKPKFGDSALYEHHTTSVVFNDPPFHTRVRKLLGPFFAARVLRQMQQRIETMVNRLLDEAEREGGLDVVNGFANLIPLAVIGDLLGVPPADRKPLLGWAKAILGALEPICTPTQMELGNRAVNDFKDYLRELIERKRRAPPKDEDVDVLWALVQASDHGDGLSEIEILHNAIFMLNAGHDTTGSLIANGVDLLLRFPDQRQRLVDQPTLIKSAIEEMLRFESPLQIGNRRCLADTMINGQLIPAGSFLHLLIASADHDERQFPDAERFDVSRDPNRHLAFAHGIHTCAGSAVARMEALVAFTSLLHRFPTFTRASATLRSNRARFRAIDELAISM